MRSLPEELEDRFSECHDLPTKRVVTSTGNKRQVLALKQFSS